jgi:transposase
VDGVRVTKVVRKLLGFDNDVVISDWELIGTEGSRANLVVWIRTKVRRKGRCGRCGTKASWFDQGGGERRWRHVDVGYATCELIAEAPRVSCPEHGPTVAEVPWARHDSAFSRAFDDLVVRDAITGSKQAAADRYGVSWRAVNNACVRLATEALGSVDLLAGLVAIAIDEVKYKKGQRYLTVVCDHFTGRVVWAAKGRSKDTVRKFFKELGEERSKALQFVTCDGADWIHDVAKEKASGATICLDTFHVVGVRREAACYREEVRDLFLRAVAAA